MTTALDPDAVDAELSARAIFALAGQQIAQAATRTSLTARADLDALHQILITCHTLTAASPRPPGDACADHLAAARVRLFQAAEEVHRAFHAASRTEPADQTRSVQRPGCGGSHPEGRPALQICSRQVKAGAAMRATATPAALRASFTGRIRHGAEGR
ncbi:hypothetical protein BIV57_07685 [Mangrovactinospora gilvigrisea]|uniref:Uncharacterized protein n=1 Tax=Mangrovactinospora gilvigrisea TaxID=1428644 RepID=A0A1J7C980_9ACTN|nr:DUF6238 family protein [Mangrovactinospora gilvigrisea]OIV38084.1 hypothetical protein BIV57_07685 [Mangrovactinospora gilvigrisea]